MPAAVNRSLLLRFSALVFLSLFSVGCAELQTQFIEQQRYVTDAMRTALAAPNPETAYWRGTEGLKGPTKIVIELSEQRALFYKGKTVVGESNISTGKHGYETPPGKYRVIQKDKDHFSNLYGDYVDEYGEVIQKNVDTRNDPKPRGARLDGASMPYFLRFTRGYGMHAGFVPRFRASHGCVRMPKEMAKHFFEAARDGTVVIVKE